MFVKSRTGLLIAFSVGAIVANRLHADDEKTSRAVASEPKAVADVIEPLDSETLQRRSIALFTDGYLTTISIIQGVALAALLAQTYSALQDHRTGVLLILAKALVVFVGIAMVQHGYLWFTTVMRWSMSFRDIVVPFALGASEIVAAQSVASGGFWWLSIFLFGGAGAIAYKNTESRLDVRSLAHPTALNQGIESFEGLRTLLRKLQLGCGVLAGFALLIFTLKGTRVGSNEGWQVLACFIVVAGSGALIRSSEIGLDRIFSLYGLRRRSDPVKPTSITK